MLISGDAINYSAIFFSGYELSLFQEKNVSDNDLLLCELAC